MNSLRNRIAILLFLAIVTVVLLATLAAVTVLRGPPPEAVLFPVIQRISPVIRKFKFDYVIISVSGIDHDGDI